MRSMLSIALVSLLAGPAAASVGASPDVPEGPARQDPGALQARCHALLPPPNTASQVVRAQARISMAECLADANLAAVQPTPDDASLERMANAARPSLAILFDVVQHGDPASAMVAEHHIGDLYIAMVVRMRNAIPRFSACDSVARYDELARRHDDLEARLRPWIARADTAFSEVNRIARARPDAAAANPVVAGVVRASRQEHVGPWSARR